MNKFKHTQKYLGSLLFTNLYQNFKYCTSNMSFTFNKFNFLKRGSVCALYLSFVMIRRARFCSFDMRCHWKSQFVILNWTCEWIKESIWWLKRAGIALACSSRLTGVIFYWQSFVCQFQFIYSFIVDPRKLNSVTRSIMALFIVRLGISFSVKKLWR